LFVACAPLPRVEDVRQLEARRAALSAERSKAVLDRLAREGNSDLLKKHIALVEAAAATPLLPGNEVKLLTDGPATYEAMFAAIDRATDHINLETYIIEDDEIGRKFSDKLLARRSQGVQVNLIYDSVGSRSTPKVFFERLRAGGIQVVEFNPVNPAKAGKGTINNRDHRKILIVDGKVAFTGGINVSDVYSSSPTGSRSSASKNDGWRDTHAQIDGPAVAELQKLYIETWREQKGPALETRNYFPPLKAKGPHVIRVVAADAQDEVNEIYYTFLSAIAHAEKTLHVTMAYFVPDSQTLTAIKDAAGRGVDVKMILPGYSDSWVVFHAGRSHYSDLLSAGVKIYERKNALLHAKTAVVDDVWSTVGSSNLDWRSFLHNDEVNVVVLGADFAREMEAMFNDDLRQATPVEKERWERRSLLLRLKEQAARLWQYWL
jgi:cardiolipin synthase